MLRSYLLLIFCVTVWGSNFVFGNILVQQFSPLFIAMARLLFISLFLIGYTWIWHRFLPISKQEWKLLILLGIIGVFINQWSFYQGLETADPTTSALILALTPITTALLAALFLKEALSISMLVGSLMAILGIFLVVFNGSRLEFHIGHLWIFITMITFAISIVLVRLLARRLPPIIITVYSTLVGFGTMVPIVLAGGTGWNISHEAWAWILLIVTAILMHGIVTLVWNSQLQKVGAAKAAMFSNLEPFVAMIFGYLVLGQLVTSQQMFGSVFIVGGVTLASLTFTKRKSQQVLSQ
ncbi:EamA family transporter [Paenibacillus sp. CGMCC 1.16610]|uniref:EamA family transporter n=1 Tax=Paenibacillus anseongense TaxID=2682845 RepID=A0ABW9TZS0_9BACL|nr:MULTISPECIES: EamA family transporter [Paenibacillus]MBA2936932.1 EamA family transporter [Paenibacillus sp. CGMCC 1.16610]MVQ33258.1 EamA family transporter [Paenibacillus anseongense]